MSLERLEKAVESAHNRLVMAVAEQTAANKKVAEVEIELADLEAEYDQAFDAMEEHEEYVGQFHRSEFE